MIPRHRDRRVALVGTGVIGAGWAAAFLRAGFDVVAWDPSPGALEELPQSVQRRWPLLEELGLAPGASPDRLRIADGLAHAVEDADFVQENGPERLELKVELIAGIDELAPPRCVIASSTSGLRMTDAQVRCAHPERTVVGHPFNPVYLLPLVEVAGGQRTGQVAIDTAVRVYAAAGKEPLVLARELPGLVANRLQEAMWREALHMVATGESSLEEIDAAIVGGPGLRWPVMGPGRTLQVAGGARGIEGLLDSQAETLEAPWTRLDAPPMTPQFRATLSAQAAALAGDRDLEELEDVRDRALLAILRARQPLT